MIVTANSRNSRPRMPLMNRIGMNTAASDMVIVRIVKPISFEPFSAASSGVSPFSMWRTMFSSITIASSTTKPIERISAIIDRLFEAEVAAPPSRRTCRGSRTAAPAPESASPSRCAGTGRSRRPPATSVMSIVTWMSRERLADGARAVLPRTSGATDGGSCASKRRQQRADRVGHLDGVAARLPHHLQRDRALRRRLAVASFV